MKEYRTNAALAAIAFAAAAAAGLAYGIRNGTFFVGALALLAVSLVWGALWVATGPESSSAKNLRPRTQLARASWVVGVVLAVLLVIAAVLAD